MTNLPNKKIVGYNGSSYLLSDLERVRKTLINRLYDTDDYSIDNESALMEIKLKRKLGIITRDVSEYYLGTDAFNEDCFQKIESEKDRKHSCNEILRFCQKDVQICKNQDCDNMTSYSYICDMCSTLLNSKADITKHLNEKQHVSASIYLMSYSTTTLYLKSRCKIKIPNASDLEINVMCPQCYFPFGANILACCLHYYYLHKPNSCNSIIYSVSEMPIKEFEIELINENKCLECDTTFNRLQSLFNHINSTRHFPFPENGDFVNVFYCPYDDCEFKSIDYPSLRCHALEHNKTLNYPKHELKRAKIKVYKKPKEFFHVKHFDDESLFDRIDELAAIESSLNLLKGHPMHKKFIKRLEARKRKLIDLTKFK